jgi:hypothetical protein
MLVRWMWPPSVPASTKFPFAGAAAIALTLSAASMTSLAWAQFVASSVVRHM